MSPRSSFDVPHTALLAMDCQRGIIGVYAKPPEEFAERAAAVLRAGRAAGMAVIHIQIGFRPGLPEIGVRNKLFGAIKSSPERQKFFEGDSGAIHPALGPEPGDIVITKHRVSAFTGSDLEIVLRANEIDTLVLFGIATSGVVLSTALDAFDRDFRIIVVSDCCADLDAAVHDALLQRFFPSRGDVTESQALIESLS